MQEIIVKSRQSNNKITMCNLQNNTFNKSAEIKQGASIFVQLESNKKQSQNKNKNMLRKSNLTFFDQNKIN